MARTMHRRFRRSPVLLTIAVAVAALALTGCGSSAAEAEPDAASGTPTPSATTISGEPLSGQGPVSYPGVVFVIPDGARSLIIAFECVGGGHYSVELGDSMTLGQALLHGVCEGTTELSWPIIGATDPVLSVTVPEGVDWTATPSFSTAPFVYDDALTADCGLFADAYSAIMNADSGYANHDAFDATEWESRVDDAAADLGDLAASAQPGIVDPVERLRAIVSDPARVVGAVLTPGALQAIGEVSNACDANQTPLILMGEFGG